MIAGSLCANFEKRFFIAPCYVNFNDNILNRDNGTKSPRIPLTAFLDTVFRIGSACHFKRNSSPCHPFDDM